MKFWINSNSGDFIEEDDSGKLKVCLLSRWTKSDDGSWVFLPYEIVEINKSQFNSLKGFVPIKEKKLHSRLSSPHRLRYAPTISKGIKGKSERVTLPDLSQARENRLRELGL